MNATGWRRERKHWHVSSTGTFRFRLGFDLDSPVGGIYRSDAAGSYGKFTTQGSRPDPVGNAFIP